MGGRADPEDGEDAQREEGDEHRELEGELDPPDVEAQEDEVAARPPQGCPSVGGAEDLTEVAADADHDHRGRQDVLHVLGEPRDVRAPRTHGGSREGVGAPGVRQRGGHLRDGEAESQVHDGDDHRRDGQAAETAGGEAEVPAEEVAADDGADAEGPERPDPRVALQAALLEIPVGGVLVADAPLVPLRHRRRG